MLPARDVAYLRDCGQHYDVLPDGGFVCLVLRGYQLPPGYTPATTDVLIRIPPGFPDAAPDMWWCSPPVRLAATGEYPIAADAMEPMLGRTWQRISRHIPPGVWRPGHDSLATYLSLIRADFARGSEGQL
jgi:Prokaryotic E2 family E